LITNKKCGICSNSGTYLRGLLYFIKAMIGKQRKFIEFIRLFKPFDRRRHVRIKPIPPIECVCIHTDNSDQHIEYPSYLKDVSKSGLLITTGEKIIYPNTQVEIRFKLPNYPQTIIVHGKVLRTFRRETHNWHYSGIKFINSQEGGIKLLLDFVSKLS
jgi:hypothetical protein